MGKQDKTHGTMESGAAIARRPVTSTVERRPNKERNLDTLLALRLFIKMYLYGHLGPIFNNSYTFFFNSINMIKLKVTSKS